MNRRQYKQFAYKKIAISERDINERYCIEKRSMNEYYVKIAFRAIFAILSATVVVMLIIELIR